MATYIYVCIRMYVLTVLQNPANSNSSSSTA